MTGHVCPYCRKAFEPDRAGRSEFPFCSRRCRWLDLSRWMNEEYSISRPLTEEDAAYLASHEEAPEDPPTAVSKRKSQLRSLADR